MGFLSRHKKIDATIERKLIEKVEVTPDGIVIHYQVGETHYLRELSGDRLNGAVPLASAPTTAKNPADQAPETKKGLVDLTRPVSKPLLKYRIENSFVEGSNTLTFGRDHPTTCNLSQVHDFIEIQVHLISQENPNLKDLYEQGHSIKEIAAQFNLAYSSVHRQLVRQQVTFRANKSVSFLENQRQTFKNSAPPAYGYCYLEGHLQKDPREYPILQIIEKQRQTGRTPTEIARYLDGKKLKTRHGKSWRQAHVFNIIQRLKITATNQ